MSAPCDRDHADSGSAEPVRCLFVCPSCRGTQLAQCRAPGVDARILIKVGLICSDDALHLSDDVPLSLKVRGDIERYQCWECGYVLGGSCNPVRDHAEVVQWLRENRPSADETAAVNALWYAIKEVEQLRTLLKRAGDEIACANGLNTDAYETPHCGDGDCEACNLHREIRQV